MKLLVTGCGRSGTMFLTKVLSTAGFSASHETLFNLMGDSWPPGHQGIEVSWLSVPYLVDLPSDVVVAHQVRNPLHVVRSFMGFGFFKLPAHPYSKFVYKHDPKIATYKQEIDRCLAYWIRWNAVAERHAHSRHRVEDVGPELLVSLLSTCGARASAQRLQAAIKKTGHNYNHRTRAPMSDRSIWDSNLGPELRDAAIRYGYDTE